jgi:hypothetical protein
VLKLWRTVRFSFSYCISKTVVIATRKCRAKMLLFAQPETCHRWNVFETTSCGKLGRGLFAWRIHQQLAHGAVSPTVRLGAPLIKPRLNQVKAGTRCKPLPNKIWNISQEQGFRGAGARCS